MGWVPGLSPGLDLSLRPSHLETPLLGTLHCFRCIQYLFDTTTLYPYATIKRKKMTELTCLSWNFSKEKSGLGQRLGYLPDSDLLNGMSHQKVISSLYSEGCSVSTGIFQSKAAGCVLFNGSVLWEIGFSFCCDFHFTLQLHYVKVLSLKHIFRDSLNLLCMLLWLVFSEISIMLQTGINTVSSPESPKEWC